MSDRLLTPLIAVGLAFLVWLYTHSRNQAVLDRYQVPVEVELASDQADQFQVEVNGPGQVPVSFGGPPSRIQELREMLQEGEVRFRQTVRVAPDRLGEAHQVIALHLDPSQLTVPPGIHVALMTREQSVAVTLRRVVAKQLQVRFVHTGGDRVEQVAVEPASVLVRGPRDVLDRAVQIPTELYVVPEGPDTAPRARYQPDEVPLVTRLGGVPVSVTPATVSVRYTLRPRQEIRELAKVPVHFLCPAGFPCRPRLPTPEAGVVTLKVRGPAGAEAPAVTAYVDLTARAFRPGRHEGEPIRVCLPPGFQLAQDPPRQPAFELVSAGGSE